MEPMDQELPFDPFPQQEEEEEVEDLLSSAFMENRGRSIGPNEEPASPKNPYLVIETPSKKSRHSHIRAFYNRGLLRKQRQNEQKDLLSCSPSNSPNLYSALAVRNNRVGTAESG